MPNNTTIKTMLNRKSCRNFSPKPISQKKLDLISLVFLSAPSAGNLKAVYAHQYNDSFVKQEISKIAFNQDWISNADQIFVFSANKQKNQAKYGKRAELYAIQDATIACAYAQIAAESLGIKSCWVGAFDEHKLKDYLKLDRHLKPVALLVLGYYGL